MPDVTSTASSDQLANIIADALKQQASQFETIIGGLQTQISQLHVNRPSTSKDSKKHKPKKTTALLTPERKTALKTPSSRPRAPENSSAKTPNTPKTPQTPTPTRKRHPLQVADADIPSDLKTTKACHQIIYKNMSVTSDLSSFILCSKHCLCTSR